MTVAKEKFNVLTCNFVYPRSTKKLFTEKLDSNVFVRSGSNWNMEMHGLCGLEGGKPDHLEINPRRRDENQQQMRRSNRNFNIPPPPGQTPGI